MKTSYFLLISFLIFTTPSHAENTQTQSQTEIENIDQAIDSLNQQLKNLRKEALNREMQAQPYMRYHWQEFTDDIEHAEEPEKKIHDLKDKLKKLKERKNLLQPLPNNASTESL
jgi:phage shock protein A